MSPLPMDSAPKDGTRVLLRYYPRYYSFKREQYERAGPIWQECRWRSDRARTGSDPHWEPWLGDSRLNTTAFIGEADAIEWLPNPSPVARYALTSHI